MFENSPSESNVWQRLRVIDLEPDQVRAGPGAMAHHNYLRSLVPSARLQIIEQKPLGKDARYFYF